MKKSYLAFSATTVALSVLASAPTQQIFQPVSPAPFAKGADIKTNGNLRVNPTLDSSLKAPAKTASHDDIIYSVDGCRQNITLTGSGYYLRGIFIRRQGTETSKVMVK